ncbi:hypothetical protein Lfu02_58810 [Longispora fulva]|uniref:Uncharacterized protein n=1 Tax=Longispora fulva TaxID=619741 RepID=A0A8J7GI80_9ACTN|nr:hypothetical protein [Longispora fulva]MBG6137137.1 hypothetical protein [Longispora fulva]GIG61509.1 hypothetical protein Lfu02_58810 [Longispora fulva]
MTDESGPTGRDLLEQWLRALTILGDSSLTPQERLDLITEVNPPEQLDLRISTPLPQVDVEAIQNAFARAASLHSRKTSVHILVENQLIAWLGEATDSSREQVLQRLALSLDQAL